MKNLFLKFANTQNGDIPFYLSDKGVLFDIGTQKVTAFDVSNPGQHKSLTLPAVSGKRGMWSSKFQNVPNKGPLPIGDYYMNPNAYQATENISAINKIKSFLGGGKFPGYKRAWGPGRYWLRPAKQNKTKRSGFSIHGGSEPGSAGCIDIYDRPSDRRISLQRINGIIPVQPRWRNWNKFHDFVQKHFKDRSSIPVKSYDSNTSSNS